MDTEFLRYKFEDGHDGVLTKTKFRIGVRHIQIIYMFLCSCVMGVMRGTNAIGILAITDDHNNSYIQIHHWSRRIQGTMLSSYFFGYAFSLLPAEKYLPQFGEKFVLTAVLLINGAVTAAMPIIVNKGGWIATSNAQFLLGMTQTCVTPINQKLLANWLTPYEKKTFNCFIQGGLLLGTIVGLPLSGLISEASLGWELIFYSQAMMTFSMAALWGLLTASTPDTHKAISDSENEFVREACKLYRKKTLKVPWRSVLKTKQFFAIAVAHASANSVFIFFLTEVPAYLKSFNVTLAEATFQVMLAFSSVWLVYILTAPTFDWAYRIGFLDHFFHVKYFRKLIHGFGALGTVVGLTTLTYLPVRDHISLAVTVLTFASLGLQFSGFLENHKDMTQNFAESLLIMTSVVASFVGAFVPFITGVIVADDPTDQTHWRLIYFILSAGVTLSAVFYIAFGNSCRQDWDGTKHGYTNDTGNLELEEAGRKI